MNTHRDATDAFFGFPVRDLMVGASLWKAFLTLVHSLRLLPERRLQAQSSLFGGSDCIKHFAEVGKEPTKTRAAGLARKAQDFCADYIRTV